MSVGCPTTTSVRRWVASPEIVTAPGKRCLASAAGRIASRCWCADDEVVADATDLTLLSQSI
jgi:hypothetical protein